MASPVIEAVNILNGDKMLETYIIDWLNLLLRWIHVIAGMTWIGTSFFFIWLNQRINQITENNSQNSQPPSLWAIHGGGVFRFTVFRAAPELFPETLHWFKWEAYATWLSGICLLLLMYYFQADIYLINNIAELSAWQATAIGLITLIGGWLIYDFICHTSLLCNAPVFAFVMLVFVAILTYSLSNFFSGRGVYIHMGALIGTLMSGNVFWVIIPAQRKMLANINQGGQWNSKLMEHSKIRSRHNNYLTLPVLFFMLSNHYPVIYNHSYNGIILISLIIIGAFSRHYFNLKHRGEKQPIILVIALSAFLILAMTTTFNQPVLTKPSVFRESGQVIMVTATKVVAIIEKHCNSCHSSRPSHELFRTPPKGIIFDTPKQIRQYSQQIKQVAIDSELMPPADQSRITRQERQLLATWIAQGALIE